MRLSENINAICVSERANYLRPRGGIGDQRGRLQSVAAVTNRLHTALMRTTPRMLEDHWFRNDVFLGAGFKSPRPTSVGLGQNLPGNDEGGQCRKVAEDRRHRGPPIITTVRFLRGQPPQLRCLYA